METKEINLNEEELRVLMDLVAINYSQVEQSCIRKGISPIELLGKVMNPWCDFQKDKVK